MPSFKIIIIKGRQVLVSKVFDSFPNKKLAENWAKNIAKKNGAEVEEVKEVKTR